MDLLTVLLSVFLILVLFCVGCAILYIIERKNQINYKKYVEISQCEIDYYENRITSVLGNGKIIKFGDEEI